MISLNNTLLSIQIVPETGASLSYFKYKDQDILRPATDIRDSKKCSLFIMLPYCGYIVDGVFTYFGIMRHVAQNDSGSHHPINGDAWKASWDVESHNSTQATLTYKHLKASGFPFDYTAKVTYALLDNQLHVTLSLSNPGKLPMPCGMGLNPYFIHKDQAKLFFKTSHVWYHHNDPIFDRPYETPKEWDFKDGMYLKESFNTSFGGWDGKAIVSYPDKRVIMTAHSIFHHLSLNTYNASPDCFSLSPVSNTPDAFNLAALGVINTGIQSIGPGQSITQTIVFEIQEDI